MKLSHTWTHRTQRCSRYSFCTCITIIIRRRNHSTNLEAVARGFDTVCLRCRSNSAVRTAAGEVGPLRETRFPCLIELRQGRQHESTLLRRTRHEYCCERSTTTRTGDYDGQEIRAGFRRKMSTSASIMKNSSTRQIKYGKWLIWRKLEN